MSHANNVVNMSFNCQSRGNLHNELIFKNYNAKNIANPWYHGLANTFMNSVDYVDSSDRKLFRIFQNPRKIADFDGKIVDTSRDVFSRKKLDCGWIDYPNLKYPNKTTGVGLRRIHLTKSKCAGMKKPFRLESLAGNVLYPKPKVITTCIGLDNAMLTYKAELPRWFGARPDMTMNRRDPDVQKNVRPLKEKLDSWIKIPYTTNFFNNIKEYEINNYLIHEIMKFDKTYLSEGPYANSRYAILHTFRLEKRNCTCPSCQKATKARTIIDATTNWLGFTNQEIGPEKLAEIIKVFTGDNPYMEYHLIEEPSKAILIKQLPLSTKVNIGINGEPVAHDIQDFTIISEVGLENPFEKDPEYNKKGRELIEIYPKCGVYKPLSWEEQLTMDDVKILIGVGKDIQRPNEIYNPTTVAHKDEAFNYKKFLPRNPDISARSILELRDWFSFCKLTRSLIRSTPHFTQLVDPIPIIERRLSGSLSMYDNIVRNCMENFEISEEIPV